MADDRADAISKLTSAIGEIDAVIAALQAKKAPLQTALDSYTDQTADYTVVLDDGNGRSLTVTQRGNDKDDAARKAMTQNPGFTAVHRKTEAVPVTLPPIPEIEPPATLAADVTAEVAAEQPGAALPAQTAF